MAENMPPAEVEVTVEDVVRLLDSQWAGFDGQAVRALDSGWDNFMFRVGDDHVARLPRRQVSVGPLVNEARWLPELAPSLPLPVPAPVLLGEPGSGYPWHWTLCPWIPGISAARSDDIDADDAAASLARFLRALHGPAPKNAPFNPYRSVPLSDKAGLASQRFEQLGAVPGVTALEDPWEEALAVGPTTLAPRWVHGDLHPHNIVVESGRVSGVVDFTDLASGDPAVDLAVAWMLFPEEARDRFWRLYGTAEQGLEVRARGWAINQCLVYLAHSADNPVMESVGQRTLSNLLADVGQR